MVGWLKSSSADLFNFLNFYMSPLYCPAKASIALVIGLISMPCFADPLNDAIKTEQATQQAAEASQTKINNLSQESGSLLTKYRFANRQVENLVVESKHLEAVLKTQAEEKISLKEQIKTLELTHSEITPLILRMLENLEKFVALDLPFLPQERQQRLLKLKAMMLKADISKAEKFRRIVEAYQVENDYGNTIEAYKDEIDLKGAKTPVDLLRLGRVGLYYQRLDGSESGVWNTKEKRWDSLPDRYDSKIHRGLGIARKESAPELLTLPVFAAEVSK